MKKMFALIQEAQQQGEDTILASIVGDSGSAPRGPGAHMLVGREGRRYGTVGGGAVEYQSIRLSQEALAAGHSLTHSFRLNTNDVEDIGMICGGNVTVYFHYISAQDQVMSSLCETALQLMQQDSDVWMLYEFAPDDSCRMGLYNSAAGLLGLEIPLTELQPRLSSAASQFSLGERHFYGEPINLAGRVLVFGGGHVSQELVPLLAHLDFRCVVIDDRPEFTKPELFPGVFQTICHDFADIDSFLHLTPNDYIVIMTRGHAHDYTLQFQALRKDTAYVGVIGSRMKIKITTGKLLNDGISQDKIDFVHWPIGLNILAETPAEIAVSVAGELIEVRARQMGKGRKMK